MHHPRHSPRCSTHPTPVRALRSLWRSSCRYPVLVAAAAVVAVPAHADQFYGFDTGYEGWSVIDGGTSLHQSAGGNPGGFIQITDATSDDFTMQAPTSALGDFSSYLGGTLIFDAKSLSNDTSDWAGFGTVSFYNGSNRVSFDAVPATAGFLPFDGQWYSFAVALTTAHFGSDLPSVFSHVTDWRIDVEPHFGISETVGVDNIRLIGGPVSAVPEPGNWALMLAGVFALGYVGRRRGVGQRNDMNDFD